MSFDPSQPTLSILDPHHVIRAAFDDTTGTIKTNLQAVGTEVIISKGTDSIQTFSGQGTYTDRSGSSANGSAQVVAANTSRQSFIFHNISDTDMYLCLTGAPATATNGILVKASGGYWENPPNFCPTNAITVYCTAVKSYVAVEG